MRLSLFDHLKRKLVKHIIWDFDGTLYQDNRVGEAIEKRYLKLLKSSYPHYTLKLFREDLKSYRSWSELVSQKLQQTERTIVDMIDTGFDIGTLLTPNTQLTALFQHKLARFNHGILSNSSNKQVLSGLKALGFQLSEQRPYGPFDFILTRDQLKNLKPHPDSFRAVLDETQGHAVQHLMIGDSHHHDLEPARQLGFQALHIQDLEMWLQSL